MRKEQLDKVFGWLTFLVLVMAVVLTFTDNPVSACINGLQSDFNNGKYYPTLSVLLITLPFLIVALPVKLFLLKKIKQKAKE